MQGCWFSTRSDIVLEWQQYCCHSSCALHILVPLVDAKQQVSNNYRGLFQQQVTAQLQAYAQLPPEFRDIVESYGQIKVQGQSLLGCAA